MAVLCDGFCLAHNDGRWRRVLFAGFRETGDALVERDRRSYCTRCGSIVNAGDAFCGACGAKVSDASPSASSTGTSARPPNGEARRFDLSSLRPAGMARDAATGAVLAVVVAWLLMLAVYLALLLRWISGSGEGPGADGLTLFALLHGGAVSLEVPPAPALLGVGGVARLGIPVTSVVLIPFLAFLLISWLVARRRTVSAFVIPATALCYGALTGIVALLGTVSVDFGGGFAVTFGAGPLSAALHASLWSGLGVLLGLACARGPLLGGEPARSSRAV